MINLEHLVPDNTNTVKDLWVSVKKDAEDNLKRAP